MSDRLKMILGPGTAVFPSVDKPNPRFEVYECGISFEGDGLEKVVEKLKEFVAENVPPKRANKIKLPVTELDDGTRFIRARTKRKPAVTDVRGRPVRRVPRIGGGSTVRLAVAFKITDKDTVTCYLQAVQLLRLVEYGAASFSDLSDQFGDDGFYAGAQTEEAQEEEAVDEGSEGDEEASDEVSCDF